MNRIDFLKQTILGGLGLTLPVELSATLTIVDYKILNGWESIMEIGKTKKEKDQLVMEVSFDSDKVWDYLRLIDSENRQWYSDDKGTTWRCGLMEFSLEEIE